jgi:hypothetical protein
MMSDLSNTLRNMKFMQRTSDSRKKTLKKPTTSQPVPLPPTTPVITMPDHPGCWRIIANETISPSQTTTAIVNSNHPSIIYRNSVFSIHDRTYTRLSFQNFNKRIEPLMIKYGLKEEDITNLEDGEIDPDDDKEEEKKPVINEETESKHSTTLGKTIRKKFNKNPFSRVQFDNKSRVTKRRRRGTRHETSNN